MKRIAIHTILFLTLIFSAKAQQTPSFSEYNHNPFLINPAYAGLLDKAMVSLSTFTARGFSGHTEGAPATFTVSGVLPFNDRNFALGVGIVSDKIGTMSNNLVQATYSYVLDLTYYESRPQWALYRPHALSFGVTAGVRFFQDDLLNLGLQNDPRFSENVSATIPTIGASMIYNHNSFFAGISAPNLIGNTFAKNVNVIKLTYPFYAYLGYRFYIDRFETMILQPNFLFKYENQAPFQADANLSFIYKNILEIGLGYKTISAVNAMVGVRISQNFRATYGYSHHISLGQSYLKSVHGFSLSCFL